MTPVTEVSLPDRSFFPVESEKAAAVVDQHQWMNLKFIYFLIYLDAKNEIRVHNVKCAHPLFSFKCKKKKKQLKKQKVK